MATGDDDDRKPTLEEEIKCPAAVNLGRRGGLKGGKAGTARMTPQQRAEIAKKAVAAWWQK
jgi:hypothetical protein